jgi:site-specific recombinase XerD
MQGIGVDIDTIRSMAGHVDIDMTRHYLHVQDPIRKDAVTRFSDTFVDFENMEDEE